MSTTYDLVIPSTIIRSDKPNKPLEAIAATNSHQMNRVIGFLPDGTRAIIAQRPGKGGMDFNKILGGKVFAVAADALSPVFEKDKDGNATKTQKTEDGMPLFSSSGFYQLSSKDYPALAIFPAYTRLLGDGSRVLTMTDAQKENQSVHVLTSTFDFDMIADEYVLPMLADNNNLVAEHDAAMNKKRARLVARAKEEADDAGEQYSGVSAEELSVSNKDGNPFIRYRWRSAAGNTHSGVILREADLVNEDSDNGLPVTHYFTAEEALAHFKTTKAYAKLAAELDAGHKVKIAFTQGHLMRTSVSFRRKVANLQSAPADKPRYGDAVYISAALTGWTKGIVSIMHTLHPNFPAADYEAHYYVAAPRQAEIGMNKLQSGKWSPPEAITYDLAA